MPDGFQCAERGVARQEREEHEGERLRKGTEGQLRHGVGVAQRGDPAVWQRRPKDGVDEDVHLRGGEAERDRKHQPADFSNAGIVQAEGRSRPPASPPESGQLHAEMQHGASDHPHRQRRDAIPGRENRGGNDDGAVIEKRRERLGQESLIRRQDADHHPAGPEKDRLEQEDPGQADDDLVIVCAVSERDQRDVERGNDEEDGRAERQDQDRGVEDPSRDLPGTLVLTFGQVLRQHRDERRADRARQQKIEQEVGNGEGHPVVIDLMAGPEGVRDHQLARSTKDAA